MKEIVALATGFLYKVFIKLLRLPSWAIVIISLLLCLFLSLFMDFFLDSVRVGQLPWYSLGKPPSPPTEIVTANHDAILIKATNGHTYICTYQFITVDNHDSSCWHEAADIQPSSSYEVFYTSHDELGWLVKKPGKIIDVFTIGMVEVDAGYWRHHVITKEGDVWYQAEIWWTVNNEFDTFLILLRGVFLGLILSGIWLTLKFIKGNHGASKSEKRNQSEKKPR